MKVLLVSFILLAQISLSESKTKRCHKIPRRTTTTPEPYCPLPSECPPDALLQQYRTPCNWTYIDQKHAFINNTPPLDTNPGYYYAMMPIADNNVRYVSYDNITQFTCLDKSEKRWAYATTERTGNSTSICCFQLECEYCQSSLLPLKNSSSLLILNSTQEYRDLSYRIGKYDEGIQTFELLFCNSTIIKCNRFRTDLNNCRMTFLSGNGSIVQTYNLGVRNELNWPCGRAVVEAEAITNQTAEIVCICDVSQT